MRASTVKAIATAAFAAMAASSVASAADMAPRYTKAPPPIVEVWNWTGFYIGGNAGYSWGRANADVTYFNPVTGAAIVPPAGSITNRASTWTAASSAVRPATTGRAAAAGCGASKPIFSGRAKGAVRTISARLRHRHRGRLYARPDVHCPPA